MEDRVDTKVVVSVLATRHEEVQATSYAVKLDGTGMECIGGVKTANAALYAAFVENAIEDADRLDTDLLKSLVDGIFSMFLELTFDPIRDAFEKEESRIGNLAFSLAMTKIMEKVLKTPPKGDDEDENKDATEET